MALKILVLSTTNSTLGPMTQGFLDYYSSKKIRVLSAGVSPLPVHSMTLKVMDSLGIPVNTSKMNFTDVGEITFDYIITFSDEVYQLAKEKGKKAKVFLLKMDTLDKTQGTEKELKNAFKSSRKELQEYCTEFAEQYLQKKIKKS
jgi:protein-tyrosine-phosphatase